MRRRRAMAGIAVVALIAAATPAARANGYLGGVDRNGPLRGPEGNELTVPSDDRVTAVFNVAELGVSGDPISVDAAEVEHDSRLRLLGVRIRERRTSYVSSTRWPPPGSRPLAGVQLSGSAQLAIGFAVLRRPRGTRLTASTLLVRYHRGHRHFAGRYHVGFTVCPGRRACPSSPG